MYKVGNAYFSAEEYKRYSQATKKLETTPSYIIAFVGPPASGVVNQACAWAEDNKMQFVRVLCAPVHDIWDSFIQENMLFENVLYIFDEVNQIPPTEMGKFSGMIAYLQQRSKGRMLIVFNYIQS